MYLQLASYTEIGIDMTNLYIYSYHISHIIHYNHSFATATLSLLAAVRLWAAVLTSSSTLHWYYTQTMTNTERKLTSL